MKLLLLCKSSTHTVSAVQHASTRHSHYTWMSDCCKAFFIEQYLLAYNFVANNTIYAIIVAFFVERYDYK